jgi:hypothetical protein
MTWLTRRFGGVLARYLERPRRRYATFSVSDPDTLRACLKPADVLLIEGNQRVSVAIKYLTQSTWSHVALYVGDRLPAPADGGERPTLVEANLTDGVVAVPLSKYRRFNSRICRPVGITDADRVRVVDFVLARLGLRYDLKNLTDLLRYLLPRPPVPERWRRSLLALGSGDPTRAICSTLIAQAFQEVGYPILPEVVGEHHGPGHGATRDPRMRRLVLRIRHHSLYTPRDFDLSPYFQVVKPTLERGFDYTTLEWADRPQPD